MASVELMKTSGNVHSPPPDIPKLWNVSQKKSLEVTETNNGVKVQTDKPHLVSLGGGRLSTAVTLHSLPKGKTTIGSSSTQTIVIQGTGIDKEHCIIENNDGIVTLFPIATMVAVDGHIISKPTRLNQGSMICFGRSNYFRFNHPEEAQFMKSLLPNTRISVAPINFEPPTDFPAKSNGFKQCPVSPVGKQSISPVEMLSSLSSVAEKRDQPIHLYRDELESEDFVEKVSKFEYLAHSQQKPITSDPNRWFVRDGITHRSLSASSSSSTASSSIPSPNSFVGPMKPLLPSETVSATSASSFMNNCQPVTRPMPKTGNNVHASLVLGPKSNFGSSGNAAGVPKFPLLPKIDAKISPKVFVPMKVPAATEKPYAISNQRVSPYSILDQKHHAMLQDLEVYEKQLEEQHQKVMNERIQEQELEQQEQQRLEEILNMCAEYERQTMKESKNPPAVMTTLVEHSENLATKPSSAVDGQNDEMKESIADSIKLLPTYGVHMNRIKTNGSLPRDRFAKPLSPVESPTNEYSKAVKSTSSEDELNGIFSFDSPLQSPTHYQQCGTTSQNTTSYTTYPQSPRTQIRTVINKEKREKEKRDEIYENHAIIKDYQRQHGCKGARLIQQTPNLKSSSEANSPSALEAKPKSPINEVFENSMKKSMSSISPKENKKEEMMQELVALRTKRNMTAKYVTELKRRAMNLDTQEDEAVRELEMELALLDGEHQDQLTKCKQDEKRITTLKKKERELCLKAEIDRELEKSKIENAKLKLELAESKLHQLEDSLDMQPEGSPEREQLVRQITHQHEIVDIEKKSFEDLEFHQLEHDSHREEEREQVFCERTQTEKEHAARMAEVTELEMQKEEMKKQIQKEVQNIHTERQTLLSYYQKEKEVLQSIDMKLQMCQLTSGMSILDVDGNSRSSSSDENEANFGTTVPDNSRSPTHKCHGDLIHHVTSTSPILIKDDSVGEKVSATLKKIDQNRQMILEKEGGLVIEKERRRVQELKKRAADEVRSQWEEKKQREANCNSFNSIESEASSVTSSDVLPESLSSEEYATDKMTDVDACPSSPDEDRLGELRQMVQQRDAGMEQLLEETRPLSEPSSQEDYEVKFRDRLHVKQQRPLTRYLPIRRDDLNLVQHIASAGHQIELCPYVRLTNTTCRGNMHKLGTKFRSWNKRWFVFDRSRRMLLYYADKNEGKPRGGISFQYIVDVYVDHMHSVKSPNPELLFCLKTIDRVYHLMAPSAEAMRIWIDVIFTGAEGYQEFS